MSLVILTAGGSPADRLKFMDILQSRLSSKVPDIIKVAANLSGNLIGPGADLEQASVEIRAYCEQIYRGLQDQDPVIYVFDTSPSELIIPYMYSQIQAERELSAELQEIVRTVTETCMTVVAPPVPVGIMIEYPELYLDDKIDELRLKWPRINDERAAEYLYGEAKRLAEIRSYLCAGLVQVAIADMPEWQKAYYNTDLPTIDSYLSWMAIAATELLSSFDRHFESAGGEQL